MAVHAGGRGPGHTSRKTLIGVFAPGGTPGGDTTAPILSAATSSATGATTATVGVTTDEGNGTLYHFVSTSATPPTAAALKAGTGAVVAGNQAVSSTGAKSASITGLTASTTYYTHWLHRDAAGNESAILTGSGFTTLASSLSSTNATRTSANGAFPEVDLTFGADIYVGYFLRVQRTLTGAGAAGDYTSPTMDILHQVTAAERSALAIPSANLVEDGYIQPGDGPYWQRYRWENDAGTVGPYSEINDTINLPATWNAADKAAAITLTNGDLTAQGTAGTSRALVRSGKQAGAGGIKTVTISLDAIGGDATTYFGFANSAAALNQRPGRENSNGITIAFGTWGWEVWRNAGAAATNYTALALVAGTSKARAEINTTNGDCKFYIATDGVTFTQRGPTVTGVTLAQNFAGLEIENATKWTADFSGFN